MPNCFSSICGIICNAFIKWPSFLIASFLPRKQTIFQKIITHSFRINLEPNKLAPTMSQNLSTGNRRKIRAHVTQGPLIPCNTSWAIWLCFLEHIMFGKYNWQWRQWAIIINNIQAVSIKYCANTEVLQPGCTSQSQMGDRGDSKKMLMAGPHWRQMKSQLLRRSPGICIFRYWLICSQSWEPLTNIPDNI